MSSRYISRSTTIEVAARDGGRCVKCGSTEDLEIDHVIPWSQGGGNGPEDLQILCRSCNRRKSDKLEEEIIELSDAAAKAAAQAILGIGWVTYCSIKWLIEKIRERRNPDDGEVNVPR